MRVLHVVPSYIPAWRYGGPIRSVHGLARSLARRGIDVHVFTTNVDGDRDSDVPLGRPVDLDGVKVWYFTSDRLRRLYYSSTMKAALREQLGGFDLVHAHSIYLWPTWAAARQAERARVPYLIGPKGMLIRDVIRRKSKWLKRMWILAIERRSLRRAAAIVVTSRRELEELQHFDCGDTPAVLIANGVDPPEESADAPGPPAPGEPPRLVFLGRVNWEKGLDRLLPALIHVPDAQLIVAGNDEENYTGRLQGIAERCGVLDRVRFVGEIRGEDKWNLLRSASLVVLPSYSENFGIAAVEAMVVGRPVAVTPEVGLADAVRETDSGIVVDGRPEVFGPALRELLERPDRLRELGRNAYDAARERFTWDSIAERTERFYDEILLRVRDHA